MTDQDQSKTEDDGNEEAERKKRAASIRKQIEELRAGKHRPPTTPREFVDQRTPEQHAEDEEDGRPPDEEP